MKRQVRTPRFVHDERAAEGMADFGDGGQVRARPVRRRAGDQCAAGAGVRGELVPECLSRGRVRQMQAGVPVWLHPDWADTRQNQARDHRLMCVAAHEQLLTRTCHRKHRGLD